MTAVDDHHVAIETKSPDSLVPYEISYIPLISRCRAEALHIRLDRLCQPALRHRAVPLRQLVPHERLELVPNPDYWDKARVPKQDRLVLLPMPEAQHARRRPALRPGELHRGAAAGRHRRG